MSAWLLPDHIADALPAQAQHIEQLRRGLLDTARSYGYALVMPPMLEYLESLLSGAGEALNLQTFKLIDQLSGRTLGLRADMTQQVARIDAHLLNHPGVTRLCYCGPVLHTRPDRPHATREPLQFGAEIYGHDGPQADVEALQLALDCVRGAGLHAMTVDLGDVRIVRHLLAGLPVDASVLRQVRAALAAKDMPELQRLTRGFPAKARDGLLALPELYGPWCGDASSGVLGEAAAVLGHTPAVLGVLQHLAWVAAQTAAIDGVRVSFDLADLRGYSYYSGTRFSLYTDGVSDALARGGRYDEVGAVFGRNRPAAGFSLDVKHLADAVPARVKTAAIRAPWREDDRALREAIAALRQAGQTVLVALGCGPSAGAGADSARDTFCCDRELMKDAAGQWVVRPLAAMQS